MESGRDMTEEPYDRMFTAAEFWSAISSCRDDSPVQEGITYSMIHHLYPNEVLVLQNLFLMIWICGEFSDVWRRSLFLPIPKLDKEMQLSENFRLISLHIPN